MKRAAFVMGAALAGAALAMASASTWMPLAPTADASLDGGLDAFGGDASDGGSIIPDASSCTGSTNGTVCGDDGGNGCAGFGGEGGTGGQGGGAAIALYVIGNSHVTVQNGAFFLARGGPGGQGGTGGNGSPGSNGDAGASELCYQGCDINCNRTGAFPLEGGAGGSGGKGGNGGNGGGGAGGPIYYYAYVNASPPTITGTTLDASAVVDGGGPGMGGPPNGIAGQAGVHP